MSDFPRTVTGKIATAKVRELILTHKTEEPDYPNTGNVKKLINTFQQLSTQYVSTTVSKGRHWQFELTLSQRRRCVFYVDDVIEDDKFCGAKISLPLWVSGKDFGESISMSIE